MLLPTCSCTQYFKGEDQETDFFFTACYVLLFHLNPEAQRLVLLPKHMHYEMHPLWSRISYVSYLPVPTEGNSPFSQLLNNVCCRKSLRKNTLKKNIDFK